MKISLLFLTVGVAITSVLAFPAQPHRLIPYQSTSHASTRAQGPLFGEDDVNNRGPDNAGADVNTLYYGGAFLRSDDGGRMLDSSEAPGLHSAHVLDENSIRLDDTLHVYIHKIRPTTSAENYWKGTGSSLIYATSKFHDPDNELKMGFLGGDVFTYQDRHNRYLCLRGGYKGKTPSEQKRLVAEHVINIGFASHCQFWKLGTGVPNEYRFRPLTTSYFLKQNADGTVGVGSLISSAPEFKFKVENYLYIGGGQMIDLATGKRVSRYWKIQSSILLR